MGCLCHGCGARGGVRALCSASGRQSRLRWRASVRWWLVGGTAGRGILWLGSLDRWLSAVVVVGVGARFWGALLWLGRAGRRVQGGACRAAQRVWRGRGGCGQGRRLVVSVFSRRGRLRQRPPGARWCRQGGGRSALLVLLEARVCGREANFDAVGRGGDGVGGCGVGVAGARRSGRGGGLGMLRPGPGRRR